MPSDISKILYLYSTYIFVGILSNPWENGYRNILRRYQKPKQWKCKSMHVYKDMNCNAILQCKFFIVDNLLDLFENIVYTYISILSNATKIIWTCTLNMILKKSATRILLMLLVRFVLELLNTDEWRQVVGGTDGKCDIFSTSFD